MGTAPLALPEGASPGKLCDPAHQRKIEQLPCRYRPSGGGTILSAGKADGRGGRYHGASQGRQPNGVGQKDE